MFGAMIGDITGSRFELSNIKTKDFELFSKDCFFTDDTVMTVAVAKALTVLGAKAVQDPQKHADQLKKEFVKQMCDYGARYPYAGYGGMFARWLHTDDPKPYNSFGNGSCDLPCPHRKLQRRDKTVYRKQLLSAGYAA